MTNEYSIEKLELNDFKILIPLMQDCFGMEVNIAYFEWKFKNNPAGFVLGYYAKHISGEIAAYYGVIPELFSINGKELIIYQSCDTMTHSKHRRKGLFQKLALHCYQFLKDENKLFVYGFGGGQSTPGFIKFGWKEIFKMNYYFYPTFFKKFQILKYDSFEEVTDFRLIEHLTLKSNTHIPIHSVKSAHIYQWRVSNPLYQYKTVAIKDNNNTYDSFITYYEFHDKLVLFDFYFENNISGKNLFNFLKSKLTNNHKGIISLVQANSRLSKLLSKYGFIMNPINKGPLNEKIPFIVYSSDQQMALLQESRNWQISSFEHDAL